MFTVSVSTANIEEDQSVMKKDLKSFEVAKLDTISKQNLDKNAHFNGNNSMTQLLLHNFAQFTGPSFRLKANNLPKKIF